jgi:hypothetical protein
MACIELSSQEANALIQAMDDSTRNRGLQVAALYASIAEKISKPFNVQQVQEVPKDETKPG